MQRHLVAKFTIKFAALQLFDFSKVKVILKQSFESIDLKLHQIKYLDIVPTQQKNFIQIKIPLHILIASLYSQNQFYQCSAFTYYVTTSLTEYFDFNSAALLNSIKMIRQEAVDVYLIVNIADIISTTSAINPSGKLN